jgi:hypothetical protein
VVPIDIECGAQISSKLNAMPRLAAYHDQQETTTTEKKERLKC